MNREQIIRMAREAGMERVIDVNKDGTRTIELPHPDLLERFAALIAAAEREACAKVLDDWKKHNWTFEDCAAVIRARSNT